MNGPRRRPPFSIRIPVLLLLVLSVTSSRTLSARPPETDRTANIILFLIDDARSLEIDIGFGRSLASWDSALESELIDKGTVFENLFNTTPVCCPSRASLLTGNYAHNTGVHGNNYNIYNGNGGWRKFWEEGYEHASLGKWLQDAGYTTALVGKFLNQYPNKPGNFVPEDYVPAGWDEWYGTFTNDIPFSYFNFRMNENGVIRQYGVNGPAYLTDVEKAHAVDFLQRVDTSEKPFFLFLSAFSPHGPIEAPPRHVGFHADVSVAAPPNFFETDLSDKPAFVQDQAVYLPRFWGNGWNERLDMTLSLDEMIRDVVDTLESRGLMDQTYILFLSDNGLMAGEHGLSGKSVLYDESARSPLIVRGPGIGEGVTLSELVMNIDVAPTILELAATAVPSVDGEPLTDLLFGWAIQWRNGVLIEFPQARVLSPGSDPLEAIEPGDQELWDHVLGGDPRISAPRPLALLEMPAYWAVRTEAWLYAEFETGERELYDLVVDPYQMESLHLTAPQATIDSLSAMLDGLRDCVGAACAAASRAVPPNAAPKAAFSAACDTVSFVCDFDASASLDVDGQVTAYAWDFGDTQTGQGESVSHEYAPPSRWVTVTLTVTDDEGAQRSGTLDLVVGPELIFEDDFESGDTGAWFVD